MDRRRRLAALGAVQLGFNLAGLAVALRRRHAYAFLFLRGRPETVSRDALLLGTALSAPGPMLLTQAWAVTTLSRRDSSAAEKALRLLGIGMVFGYAGEELVRRRLTPGTTEPIETPIAAAGIASAALLALGGGRPPGRD